MKKFTLIAAIAALMGTSAFAEAPLKVAEIKAGTAKAELSINDAKALVAKDSKNLNFDNRIEATEGEDEVTVDMNVSYVHSSDALYIGMTPGRGYISLPVGLTGIRGEASFRNMTQGADAFTWEFNKEIGADAAGNPVYETITTNDVHGFMPLAPAAAYTFPTLKATFGEDEVEYTSATGYYYFCGGAPDSWGLHRIPEDAEYLDFSYLYGVAPCAVVAEELALYADWTVRRPGASGYDETRFDTNGTYQNWYYYSDEEQTVENIRIKAFGTYIPAMPSPYQLDGTWAWINTVEATEDIVLPITVYAIDEDGKVDFDAVLGVGEMAFPAGASGVAATGTMPTASLYAIEDGYPIEAPICVPAGQDVMVCIEGLDNPNLLQFDLASNGSTIFPDSERPNATLLYPQHTFAFADFTLTIPGQEPVETSSMLDPLVIYYGDDAGTKWVMPSDVLMYFNINFPLVMNPVDETANFEVEVPVEGGEVVVPVYCDYIIDALITEDMVYTMASDWLTFSTAFDEAQAQTNVTINAAALPEGETGRTGYVAFEGFAIDFHITVKQGEESGIEGIEVRPVAKGTKFFDLQGRQLQTAPAAGMYIESVDGKATKRIAR